MTSQHDKAKRQGIVPQMFGCWGGVIFAAAVTWVAVVAFTPKPIQTGDAIRIQEGLTEAEVRSILGEPHNFHFHSLGEWVYKTDQFGIKGPFFVEFDEDGRVEFTSWQ